MTRLAALIIMSADLRGFITNYNKIKINTVRPETCRRILANTKPSSNCSTLPDFTFARSLPE
jgi:hypothetical protein